VIAVTVNGVHQDVPAAMTLLELLELRSTPARGVAVAMDFEVVRRADWETTLLHDGAVIEVVTAAAGG